VEVLIMAIQYHSILYVKKIQYNQVRSFVLLLFFVADIDVSPGSSILCH